MIAHKLALISLGGGIPIIFIINFFKGFFIKVFRYIAAILWCAIGIVIICAVTRVIQVTQMIHLLFAFGFPLRLLNRFIV